MSCSVELGRFFILIKPAFEKLAAGTSKSGEPTSPIDPTDHPAWDDEDGAEFIRERGGRFFTWDHPDWTALSLNPYFKQQPTYNKVFTLAEEIKAGKLTKMNKAEKTAVATQILMAAADAEQRRSTGKESKLLLELQGKMEKWLMQLKKMRQEEMPAAAPGGDDCCCTIM